MEIVISDGKGLRAVVNPGKGATVTSLSLDGEEFLYQNYENINSEERPRCGIPFIFPSFGRLADGSYTLGGNRYQMGIHGFAHTSSWEVVDQKTDSLKLRLTDDEKTYGQYPFHFCVALLFRVADDCLTIHQTYRNLDSKPMPFACGIHPYFNIPASGEASVNVKAKFCSQTKIGKRTPLSGEKISAAVTEDELSMILEEAVSPVMISIPSKSRGIKLIFDECFSNVVLWRMRESQFLCVEPICGKPNGLNTGEHALLPPGESLETEIRILLTNY